LYSVIIDPTEQLKYKKDGDWHETNKNVSASEPPRSFEGIQSSITALACSNGKYSELLVYAGTAKGDIIVLHAAQMNYISTLKGHSGAISFVKADCAGRFIITGSSEDQTVRVWNAFAKTCERMIPSLDAAHAVISRGRVFIGGRGPKFLTVWGVGPGEAGWSSQSWKEAEEIKQSLAKSGIATTLNKRSAVFQPTSSTEMIEAARAGTIPTHSPQGDQEDAWVECWDEASNTFYFFNDVTGQSSWMRPKKYKKFDSASASPKSGDHTSSWVSYVDEETGHPYWYNKNTGETKWDLAVQK